MLYFLGEKALGQVIYLEDVIMHPDYDNTAYQDIAVIKLKEDITFTTVVHPICLPKEPLENLDQRTGKTVDVVGYADKDDKSVTLKVTSMEVLTQDLCNEELQQKLDSLRNCKIFDQKLPERSLE